MGAMGARELPVAARALLACTVLCALPQTHAGVSKEAVVHIQCQVCEFAVEQAKSYASENSISDEDALSDLVDGLCSIKNKAGRWVSKLDIYREDSDAQLQIELQDTIGVCKTECLTVQRACAAALKGQEESLVGLLQSGKTAKEMKKKLCKKTCKKTPPKLAKWVDEAFEGRDEKEVETEDMLEKMKAETGMGMKMYKREDLLSMSEGDMEVMAAREAFGQERAAAKMAAKEDL
uniref:Saposin B-type domain-containing protein n=1 Tax=Alexandrium catenella TaxID=2925 RepID=A0A7S1L2Q5_ALECA|mmetsp:Transcript_105266/g.280263  ORF Transcript_105266/g.280263 Transcript_105266/m.280263 type:complete len:235 (+) Transcript_105266:58-762(+)